MMKDYSDKKSLKPKTNIMKNQEEHLRLDIYNKINLLEEYPDNSNLYYSIGYKYRLLKQFEKSLEYMNMAIELNPDESSFYWSRAAVQSDRLCYSDLSFEERKAIINDQIPDLEFCLSKDGTSQEAWLDIAEKHIMMFQFDDAISTLGRCQGYIKEKYYKLVHQFLKCIALTFLDYPIETEDQSLLIDTSYKTFWCWCVSEMQRTLYDLYEQNKDPLKIKKATEYFDLFLIHLSGNSIGFNEQAYLKFKKKIKY